MKKLALLLSLALVSASMVSCKTAPGPGSSTPPTPGQSSSASSSVSSAQSSSGSGSLADSDDAFAPETMQYSDYDYLKFSDLFGQIFYFYSGAGAWCTMVHINTDGTFNGYFLDSDAGSQTMCIFSGAFTSLKKTGAYEYSMTCETLNIQNEVGSHAVLNGIPTTYASPYGFDDAKEFKLYLPGKPLDELPLEFKQWVQVPWEDPENDNYYRDYAYGDVLTTYGLYNEQGKQGFSANFQ